MSWMIFFLCLLLVFENFQTLSRFLWRLFCMFVSFQLFDFRICTSLTTWKKGSNKTSSSSVWYFVSFLFFVFFAFPNLQGRVRRGGSTEATRQVGRMSGKSTTRTVWPGPPSRTIFPTHFASTSSSSSTHSTSSSHNLQHSHHVHGILSSQVFVGQ